MDGLNNINAAISYIEDHLDTTIDLKKASQQSFLSEYHLSRMFTQLFGISLFEYVRRRRLTMAAFELQNEKARVIDIALKYGYESADSFSRAFKKLHSITPSQAKKVGARVVAFPRMSVHINIEGDTGINYRLVSINDTTYITGKGFTIHAEKPSEDISNAWQSMSENGNLSFLSNEINNENHILNGLLGVYGEGAEKSTGIYDYFIGAIIKDDRSKDYKAIAINRGRWLVFTNLIDARRKLYSEWIPTLGYDLDVRPFIECILNPFDVTKNELWVPIK